MEGELWHLVEAKRDDGAPTMFRIRELDPDPALDRIFVVEMPYRTTEHSRLPDAADYRRLAKLEQEWVVPACHALGWQLVGSKTEDGSFFLYMYGASDPSAMMARLAPFDAALGFYDDADPAWAEYATLRELLAQAKAMPTHGARDQPTLRPTPMPRPKSRPKAKAKAKPTRKPKAKPRGRRG